MKTKDKTSRKKRNSLSGAPANPGPANGALQIARRFAIEPE